MPDRNLKGGGGDGNRHRHRPHHPDACSVNKAMNLPEEERKQATLEKLQGSYTKLDEIGDGLAQKIPAAQLKET